VCDSPAWHFLIQIEKFFVLRHGNVGSVTPARLDDKELGLAPQHGAVGVVKLGVDDLGVDDRTIPGVNVTVPAVTQNSQNHHISVTVIRQGCKVLKCLHTLDSSQIFLMFRFEMQLVE
jgi:hypothetical protein